LRRRISRVRRADVRERDGGARRDADIAATHDGHVRHGMEEPFLELHDIQGNILPGFRKPHLLLIGLRIENASGASAWLRSLLPHITTAEEVHQFARLRRVIVDRGGTGNDLSSVWTNVVFSIRGLVTLTNPAEVEAFEDAAFRLGQHRRSGLLGDPQGADVEGDPSTWIVGGRAETVPDVFVIIGADDRAALVRKAGELKSAIPSVVSSGPTLTTPALRVVYDEHGDDLPPPRVGHEHFGFRDGISQPGIRGRSPAARDGWLTPRLIDPADPDAIYFSKPGQPLVWPGQFVFGYPTQEPLIPTQPGPPRPAPVWARNGSFLVFRRLRQDVAKFWQTMAAKAEQLSAKQGFDDLKDPRKLAATIVGRWPSGAPIMRTPDQDDDQFATEMVSDHFRFDQPSHETRMKPGHPIDALAMSPADANGFICPHAAHIRKVNPRDITTEQGSATDVLARRVLRRGIPFGAPLEDPFSGVDPLDGQRGLLFLSYQTSIEDQFEFIVKNWMNKSDAPEDTPGGHDLLVGQSSLGDRAAVIRRRRGDDVVEAPLTVTERWIVATGGGYFFCPSLSAVRDVLGRRE
jgi:Dyp-type peroxidase family